MICGAGLPINLGYTGGYMQDVIRHQIGQDTGVPGVYKECSRIYELDDALKYIIDVSFLQHCEPIGMLLLGSAIRNLKGRGAVVEIVGRNDNAIQEHSYASRMGFFWSIGEDTACPARSQNPSGSTIPVSRLLYEDLFRRAGSVDPIRSGLVSDVAEEIAKSLSGKNDVCPVNDALEFSIREMIRNTFEHSQSNIVWYVASSRITKDEIQVAILDEGRGIRKPLEETGLYSFASDAEAIKCALKPGVSRNINRKRTAAQEQKLIEEHPGEDPAKWDNSGYGLTLTSQICKVAGQFTIISNGSVVSYIYGADIESDITFCGTAIRIVLQPSRLADALHHVGLAGEYNEKTRSITSASRRLRRHGLM